MLLVQYERARVIYKYALDHLPKDRCEEVYKAYSMYEKRYGDRAAIEDVVVSKRKLKYEEVSTDWLFCSFPVNDSAELFSCSIAIC